MRDLRGARLKINRADKHVCDLENVIGSFERNYVSSIEIDRATGAKSVKYECPNFGNFLTEIALISGDALHNLRTALDHAWLATIEALSLPSTKWTKFPFCHSSQELEQVLAEREISIACPKLFNKVISEIRPYRGGNDLLCALHDVDIIDKHKLLVPVLDSISASDLRVEDEHGAVDVHMMPKYGTNGIIYVDFFPHVQIKDKGHVSIAVFFEEKTGLSSVPIPYMLHYLSSVALKVVEILESALIA